MGPKGNVVVGLIFCEPLFFVYVPIHDGTDLRLKVKEKGPQEDTCDF